MCMVSTEQQKEFNVFVDSRRSYVFRFYVLIMSIEDLAIRPCPEPLDSNHVFTYSRVCKTTSSICALV
jgi:hypothetical protein